MGANTTISWTDHTFNPWRGCTKISAGCAHCYADAQSVRNPGVLGIWGPNGTRVVASETMWREPLRWNEMVAWARATIGGTRNARVFCASLADVFEDWTKPITRSDGVELCVCHGCGDWVWYGQQGCHSKACRERRLPRRLTMADVRRRLFSLIDQTPNLDWLLLTKRPEHVLRMAFDSWCQRVPGHVQQNEGDGRRWKFPPNLWLGVSVEDQATAEQRIPHLLRVPAAVRFLSIEPLLGPIDLTRCPEKDKGSWSKETDVLQGVTWQHSYCDGDDGYRVRERHPSIDWVIVGGESGPHARPMDPAWARSIRDQCRAAGVPFFFKQAGGRGKDKGGNLLDGEIIQEFPAAKHGT